VLGRRVLGGALHRIGEPARQPAREHQRLDHVAGDIRAADPAKDLRVSTALAGGAQQHEVAGAGPAVAVHDQPAPPLEERRGDEEASALLQLRDDGRGPGQRGRASAAMVFSATSS
jgi:hypothetical protein